MHVPVKKNIRGACAIYFFNILTFFPNLVTWRYIGPTVAVSSSPKPVSGLGLYITAHEKVLISLLRIATKHLKLECTTPLNKKI